MDEKKLLLEEIKHYQSVVNQSINLHQEHESYFSKPAIFSGFGIIARIITFFVLWIITVNVVASKEFSMMNTLFLMFLFGTYIYFLFIWPTVHVKKKIKRNKLRINEIQTSIDELNSSVNPKHLPKMYINKHDLLMLESYLINKRADTLKEALNLYHQEIPQEQMRLELNAVQELQEMTYKRANDATTLGWLNLIYRR